MKSLLFGAGLLLSVWLSTPSLHAATLSVVPGEGITQFAYASGETITGSSAYSVRVGYFTNVASSEFAAGLSDPTTLVFDTVDANFVAIGEGSATLGGSFTWSIGELSGEGAGNHSILQSLNSDSLVFTNTAPANSRTDAGLPRGSRLFLLVYDNADPAAASELGIFSAEEWIVPSDGGSTLVLNLQDVDSDAEVFRGAPGASVLQLAAVIPEPSAGVFVLLAGAGMLAGRRRGV